MISFDAVVIGAGPAGAIIARQIALAGHRVLLADNLEGVSKPGESLPGAARPLLAHMGLLESLQRSAPQPAFGNLSSWGEEALHSADFIRDPNGLGWHLDRNRFDACLRDAAYEAGVIGWGERLQDVHREAECWEAIIGQQHVSARFLVDASGRRSIVAHRLGLKRHRDAELIALYAKAVDHAHDRRTVIEATANGWWYTAPLPCGKRIAVLHVLAGDASRILREKRGWHGQLSATRHIGKLCSPEAAWSSPRGTEAGALEAVSGEGWVAAGDAAMAFDPLFSQGIFNALYSAMRGGQAVNALLAGQPGEMDAYRARLGLIRQTYLLRLKHFYSAEQRWPAQSFWRVREKG